MTRQGANIPATTWATSRIQFLRVSYVLADPAAIFMMSQHSFRLADANHIWYAARNGEGNQDMSAPVPGSWRSGDRITIWGFVGYDMDIPRNIRVYARNGRYEDNGARYVIQVGTCIDSILILFRG